MGRSKKKVGFLQNKYFWLVVGIILLGAFLRAYNFSPWLHFELDQSRDATLIRNAMNGGVGELPLLGPRAAGTFLRLGPAFYYLEYLFAVIINDAAVGSALAILFFAILTLPIFYFFVRNYFSKKIATALLLILACSLFLITYSRFGWNPNLLPFFVLLFLIALLRAVDKSYLKIKRNKKKVRREKMKRGGWLLLASVAFGLLAQFHFLALIVLSITGTVFLLIKRPKIKPVFWAGAVMIVLLLHTPMIINDFKTGGANVQEFIKAVTKKSDKKSDKIFIEKFARDYSENSLRYWTILTGSQRAELPKVKVKKTTQKIDIQCDKYCRENMPAGTLALIIFSLGIILSIVETFLAEKGNRKNFLILNLTLLAVSFAIFFPLAFDLSPRFFLITMPLPFVMLGLILRRLARVIKIKNIIWVVAIIFVISNLYFTFVYFNQLQNADLKAIDIGADKILKQKTRITLEQEKKIVDYMQKFYKQNKYPVFYHGQSEFHRAFAYLLDGRKIPRDGIGKSVESPTCRQGNYFLIIRTQSGLVKFENFFSRFVVLEKKEFGTLIVYRLRPKEEMINCIVADQSKFRNYKGEGGAVAKRYNWNEIFAN